MNFLSFAKDLESLFSSYGYYHQNHINKIIHIIFVPIIAPTLLGIGWAFPDSLFRFDYLFFLVTMLLYIKIDLISGLLCVIIYGSGYYMLYMCSYAYPEYLWPAIILG